VLRGGAWNNNRDNVRCANRNHNEPDNRNNNVGFRVVLVGASARRCFPETGEDGRGAAWETLLRRRCQEAT
jgi:hypothetical protein